MLGIEISARTMTTLMKFWLLVLINLAYSVDGSSGGCQETRLQTHDTPIIELSILHHILLLP